MAGTSSAKTRFALLPGHDGNTLASSLRERSYLLLPGGRLPLRLARLLLGAMAAVGASGERADRAVMSGIVAGDAADHGAFQAAFCVGRRGGSHSERGQGKKCEQGFHDAVSPEGVRGFNRHRAPLVPSIA